MATNHWNVSLTPYHKKEGINYLITKLNRYARNLNQETMAMAVEYIAKDIARQTANAYREANYDGYIDIRNAYKGTPFGGFGAFGTATLKNTSSRTVVVYAQPDKKGAVGNNVIFYTKWHVVVEGQLGSFLEFGTGDKYRSGSGYAYRYASTYMRSNQAKHFTGNNGLDTWVYKGEAGTRPATPNNQVLNRKGEPREGYYYSQGNYPTRGLYNAVRRYKRSPSNVRNIVKTIYYKHLKANH